MSRRGGSWSKANPLEFPVIKQRLLGHQTFFIILKIHAILHENTHTHRYFTKIT